MKRILKVGVVVCLMVAALSMAFATTASANRANMPLEQMLVGTWRWDETSAWIVVFRPDGTGVDGMPGLRTEFNWHVRDGRLFWDGVDTNFRGNHNAITLDRLGSTYTYLRYSDSYDATTSLWLIITILVIVFLVLPIGVIILIVVLIKRKKRKNTENDPYGRDYDNRN